MHLFSTAKYAIAAANCGQADGLQNSGGIVL
jgi:hypothetical protein